MVSSPPFHTPHLISVHTDGLDYVGVKERLTFFNNITVNITIISDQLEEKAERFRLLLSQPTDIPEIGSRQTILTPVASVVILDETSR